MDYVPGYIGLKITNVSSWAKCISIVRKYNNISMAEIRKCIESNEYILLYKTIDTSGIKKIRKCYDELIKNNITSDIYERYDTDNLITRELLSNLIDSHRITAKEVADEIFAETGNN